MTVSGDVASSERLQKSHSPKLNPPLSPSDNSDRQLNFEGFGEEDDMITLGSHSTVAAKSQTSSSVPVQNPKEERDQFIARMESMLEKVEESIMESRPSDEIDESINSSFSVGQGPFQSQVEEDIDDDDSTNVVATQVASETREEKSVREGERAGQLPYNKILSDPQTKMNLFQRPTHIVVDTGLASPAHTNITMDATMLNDTLASTSILDDGDNLSTITPILDRYRLDPDDNSVGVKVVPNKRGMHTRLSKPVPEVQESLSQEYHSPRDTFRSPKVLPGSVSARKKKYRKTPFPRKQLDDGDIEPWDENTDPNLQPKFMSPKTAPMSAISIPPLRPRSMELRKSLPRKRTSTRTHQSLPGQSTSRTPLSDAFVAKHMSPTTRV